MFEAAPRLYLIDCLRKDLLGPRSGLRESLPRASDPRDEYVTGVLDVDSRHLSAEEQVASELESPCDGPDACAGEEMEWDRPTGLVEWTPSCDPRREPSAMGLSWVVRGPANAGVDVACTLAGYRRQEEVWQRRPHAWVHRFGLHQPRQEFVLEPTGCKLLFRCRNRGDDCYQLNLMLVHLGWNDQPRTRTERLLFQPQLRVLLDPELQALGLWEFESAGQVGEESRLRLLYRDSPVMARGHFCAAVWRSIDPQRSDNESPWQWPDGELLSVSDRSRFANCDLRSEFLPVIPVQSPDVEWRHDHGPSPELSARSLSECFGLESIQAALAPLVAGYGVWIENLQVELDEIPERYREQARHHLQLCRESQTRMGQGLQLLLEDAQARLAFCFANRALALQAEWKGVELSWRPFQLGFWLQSLVGLTQADHPDRMICDLLWFPTGGGKTEAYLAIVAYVLGLRRLRRPGFDGTGVISRYTLRLLSIQQFRRALGLVTACEVLRTQSHGLLRGWRPQGSQGPDWLWGESRFSTGLWVGESVTPNSLQSTGFPDRIPGAVDLLSGKESLRGHGEPAQVLDCPCCNACLSIPEEESFQSSLTLHHLVRLDANEPFPSLDALSTHLVQVRKCGLSGQTLSFELEGTLKASILNEWWSQIRREWLTPPQTLAAQFTRPGYFLRFAGNKPVDFEVYCPNPGCLLNQEDWSEQSPTGPIVPPQPELQGRIPIPALTVDEQLYGRPPSLLLATVDKFARLAYEPKAATLFGNVEYHHPQQGYYRVHCTRERGKPHPPRQNLSRKVEVFRAPELILQDELHLIDGPLGSMVGLYETVIQRLCAQQEPPKYIASTATVREAADQVRSLFQRELRQFPSAGLSASDNFFARLPPGDAYQKSGSGRLYMGLCAPGRGPITPLVRCWAAVLQAVSDMPVAEATRDAYFTPVGYFNSIHQLALVGGLWRQSILQRLQLIGTPVRELLDPVELSSRIESERLPILLKALESPLPAAAHGVLATSMFGTGVDVSRLSLMLVHGQPKTTSSYIQATGRVGRQQPGLVLTALSSTRPRELNHYEYFTGYHLQLYRGVEPVTVFPFAPRARERGLGPLCVAALRQRADVEECWRDRSQGARRMANGLDDSELEALVSMILHRAEAQPELRRPRTEAVEEEVQAALRRWQEHAREYSQLDYEEYSIAKAPTLPVVLGDPQHLTAHLPVVFRNAPQSLREVEPTTGFKI